MYIKKIIQIKIWHVTEFLIPSKGISHCPNPNLRKIRSYNLRLQHRDPARHHPTPQAHALITTSTSYNYSAVSNFSLSQMCMICVYLHCNSFLTALVRPNSCEITRRVLILITSPLYQQNKLIYTIFDQGSQGSFSLNFYSTLYVTTSFNKKISNT